MLWKGADWLVDSAAEIAHSFKVSDLIIGLTVVALVPQHLNLQLPSVQHLPIKQIYQSGT